MQSVTEAGAWLESLINLERRPDWPYARLGLGPIRRLLARLGDPQRDLACVHVAGSKGKGSTALLIEAILGAAGERVGTFVSPHLERWTERVRLEGREIDAARLVEAVAQVRQHVDALRQERPEDAPTFFDATTAVALVCFRAAGVERAVLEVGLGGRLDSTNVVRPQVACITSIELEHTDKLGDTLAAIAGEKAGILKPGVPGVVGALPEEAAAVVRARAEEVGVEISWAGRDFGAEVLGEGPRGRRLRLWDGEFACQAELSVRGRHQPENAALALACVRRAAPRDVAALATAAARGLSAVELPGRLEIVRSAPLLVVDSAHTAASARALAEELALLPRRRTHLVLSVSADKQLEAILDALLPAADELTLTRADAIRSLAPDDVAVAVHACAPDLPVRVVPNPHLALRAAAEGLAPEDCAVAAGSVYLAGIARRAWCTPAPVPVAVTRSGSPRVGG